MTNLDISWVGDQLALTVKWENDHLSDAVIVVTFRGGLDGALERTFSTRRPGRRIVRLLYDWSLAIRIAQCRTITDARDQLRTLAAPSEVLRARMRYTRWKEQSRHEDSRSRRQG